MASGALRSPCAKESYSRRKRKGYHFAALVLYGALCCVRTKESTVLRFSRAVKSARFARAICEHFRSLVAEGELASRIP